ncbi:hypothetical protein C0989_011656 [Termitomyces sp. Mn162]|nr:hypothetical protein C0989_011656 [Termitomyces sp. Mn162]
MVLSLDTLPAYSPLHSSHTLPLHTSLLSSTSSAPTKVDHGATNNFTNNSLTHLTTTTFLKFSNSNTSPTEDNPLLHESKLSPLLTDNDKTSNYQPPSHTPLPSHFWLLLAPPTYWLNLILHLNRNNCLTLGPASFNTSSPPKGPEDITNISVMTRSLKPRTLSDKPPLPRNPPLPNALSNFPSTPRLLRLTLAHSRLTLTAPWPTPTSSLQLPALPLDFLRPWDHSPAMPDPITHHQLDTLASPTYPGVS